MSTDGLSEAVAAYRRGDLTDRQRATAEQVRLAAEGRAVGQCGSCGSFTADGKPPILHHDWCATKHAAAVDGCPACPDGFRCICDATDVFDPPDPTPRAVEGCPAHRARRAYQQWAVREGLVDGPMS